MPKKKDNNKSGFGTLTWSSMDVSTKDYSKTIVTIHNPDTDTWSTDLAPNIDNLLNIKSTDNET